MKTKNKHLDRGITDVCAYYIVSRTTNKTNQPYVIIECPFCNDVSTIPQWCLTSKGYNCSCGALFTNDGQAHRLATTTKRERLSICEVMTTQRLTTMNKEIL